MSAIKRLLLKTLVRPGTPAFLKHVQRHCATVFMLHRFEDTDRGIEGCDLSHLRRALTYLGRNKYEFVSLTDLIRRLAGDGPEPAGAVAFTIDDGYIDQATIAAPVFAEFDCPVTTFVSSGFLDGKLWFWWDQIEYVFANCRRAEVASAPWRSDTGLHLEQRCRTSPGAGFVYGGLQARFAFGQGCGDS